MYGFGLMFSVEDFENEVKRIINDKDEMERLTGNGLSKKENQLLYLFNYIGDNTKFKKVSLNSFENITFESKNRLFLLEVIDDHIYLVYKPRGKNKYDKNKGQITGNFYTLRNWFKKRNYLK